MYNVGSSSSAVATKGRSPYSSTAASIGGGAAGGFVIIAGIIAILCCCSRGKSNKASMDYKVYDSAIPGEVVDKDHFSSVQEAKMPENVSRRGHYKGSVTPPLFVGMI